MYMYKDFEVNEWLELLNNRDVFKEENMLIMRRLMDLGGEATCSQLANKYGETWAYYSSMCSKLAQRVAAEKNIDFENGRMVQKFVGRYYLTARKCLMMMTLMELFVDFEIKFEKGFGTSGSVRV